MKKLYVSTICAGVAALLLSSTAMADTVPAAPNQSGNIEFVTGGIGDEERTSMEAVQNNYNLHVISAGVDGAFVGNMHLTLLDNKNAHILETDIGPLFYAKLPNGNYIVEGTHNNQTKSEKITVAAGKPNKVHFSWK